MQCVPDHWLWSLQACCEHSPLTDLVIRSFSLSFHLCRSAISSSRPPLSLHTHTRMGNRQQYTHHHTYTYVYVQYTQNNTIASTVCQSGILGHMYTYKHVRTYTRMHIANLRTYSKQCWLCSGHSKQYPHPFSEGLCCYIQLVVTAQGWERISLLPLCNNERLGPGTKHATHTQNQDILYSGTVHECK